MKKEDIIALPNKKLRQPSSKVHVITDDIRKLVSDMIDVSIDWENSRPHEISAALAAVQVGSLKRVIVVRSDFDDKENREFTALINPEIVKFEGEIKKDYEGCLSVGDIYGLIPRHTKIRVKALDIDGNEVRFKADGFLARVIQHEIDHTKGILFIDHIKDQPDSFFKLNENGDLQKLDYEKYVKTNHILWD